MQCASSLRRQIHVRTNVNFHVHGKVDACICMPLFRYERRCVNIHMLMHMRMQMHMRMHMGMHMQMYMNIHVCTYTYTYMYSCTTVPLTVKMRECHHTGSPAQTSGLRTGGGAWRCVLWYTARSGECATALTPINNLVNHRAGGGSGETF